MAMGPLVRLYVQRRRPARVDVLKRVFQCAKWKGKYYFGNTVRKRVWIRLRKKCSLALAIVRHKQSIGKTLLLDNIDPKIIARLADLGIDYYAYSHYNLTTIIHIIKYFWFVVLQTTTPTSPTPSSTVSDQANSHRIYNSSH